MDSLRHAGVIALLVGLCACVPSAEPAAPTPEEPPPIDEDLFVHGVTQVWPRLQLNELMAVNRSTVVDPTGRSSDWIELHNPGEEPVDLLGWTLTDDPEEPDKHELDSLEVPAGGQLLLWADDDPALGPDHLRFSLDALGEAVGLYAPDGTAIDLLSFGLQASDVVLGRFPDGTGAWDLSTSATPGQPNGDAP